jgi:hypothetical protein
MTLQTKEIKLPPKMRQLEAQGRIHAGLRAIEALADILVFLKKIHIEQGIRGSMTECALAQSLMDNIGQESEAVIMRGIAWVKAPLETDEWVWMRFRVSPKTRRSIETFDRVGDIAPGGYLFKAPTVTQTRAYRKAKRAARREVVVKKGSRGKIKTGEISIVTVESPNGALYRNGSGCVKTTRDWTA